MLYLYYKKNKTIKYEKRTNNIQRNFRVKPYFISLFKFGRFNGIAITKNVPLEAPVLDGICHLLRLESSHLEAIKSLDLAFIAIVLGEHGKQLVAFRVVSPPDVVPKPHGRPVGIV